MKKCAVVLTLLVAASASFGANIYWKSDAAGSDVFTLAANWSATPYNTVSDSLRVGGSATYTDSTNLCKLTTGWGAVDSTVNDSLLVGGVTYYPGNFELDCGSGGTAFFKSIIVGDTKAASTDADSIMTITSGTIANNPDTTIDTGYITIGRNNTLTSTNGGVGYLYINGGTVGMDRMTIGELRATHTVAGTGHVVLQGNGVINLPCQRVFDPPSMVGLKVNNGDFTWNDNGNSSVTTGVLLVNTASLIFQSSDNSFGTDGKGIVIESGKPSGDGSAIFTTDALIDVTGLADTTNWVTLITAAGGIIVTNTTLMTTVTDATLLTPASIVKGWRYRLLDLDGEAGNATALQVSIRPILACSAANGILTVSWSPLYVGWTLQAQTNTLSTGLTSTWAGTDIPGTDLITSTSMPISLDNPAVFFRLRQ
jgi:hypothetical protein